jgi:hypothetical protein
LATAPVSHSARTGFSFRHLEVGRNYRRSGYRVKIAARKLALLVLVEDATEVRPVEIKQMLKEGDLGDEVLSMSSVTFLCHHSKSKSNAMVDETACPVHYPCTRTELAAAGISAIKGYNETSLKTRLGASARFIIARPDFFVHSIARTAEEFHWNAKELKKALYPTTNI